MQLYKSSETIELLREKDSFFDNDFLKCLVKEEEKIKMYIFTAEFKTENELCAKHEIIRDHLAISFQSQTLKNDPERWNMYLFYFLEESIDNDLRQIIEQDKFSMRKIVCDGNGTNTDEIILEFIEKELFTFDISKREVELESMSNLLEIQNPEVFKAINQLGEKITTNDVDKLLNFFPHEQS